MTWITLHDELDDIYNDWDAPATPIAPPINVIPDENGWIWYPDSNGQLCSLYFDHDGNECMVWRPNDDGSFYWRCANVGYNCRDIDIEERRGIFFQDVLVGTMTLDNQLSVVWLPETYINNIENNQNNDNININNDINYININTIHNDININITYDDITDVESDDNYDP